MVGSGLDVWEVIATLRDNSGSVQEAADYLQMPLVLVQAGVAHCDEHPDKIDAHIDLNEAEYQRGFDAAAADHRARRG